MNDDIFRLCVIGLMGCFVILVAILADALPEPYE